MIPVIIIQADATSDTWRTFAEVANWLIWAVFAVEIAVVLVVAPRKRAALRAHWLDAAIVVVTFPRLRSPALLASDLCVSSGCCGYSGRR